MPVIKPYQLKRSVTVNAGVPLKPTTLLDGELAMNFATGFEAVYLKNAAGTVIAINDWSKILNKPTTLSGYGISDSILRINAYNGDANVIGNIPAIVSGSGTMTNGAVNHNATSIINLHCYDGAYRSQIEVDSGSAVPRVYVRGMNATVWGSWYTLWNSGNSNLTTTNWAAQNLTLNGSITGATTGSFSSTLSSADHTINGTAYNMLTLARVTSGGSSILFKNSAGNLGQLGFDSNGNLTISRGTTTSGVSDLLSIGVSSGLITTYGHLIPISNNSSQLGLISARWSNICTQLLDVNGAATFYSTIDSSNFQRGKTITSAPTAFQTSMFGSNNNGYRIKIYRHDYTNDIFGEYYSPGIAVSSGDTHWFMNVSYGSGSKGIYIGSGAGDSIFWSAKVLIDSSNIFPSADNAYSIGGPLNKYANIYSQLLNISGSATFGSTGSFADNLSIGLITAGAKLHVRTTGGNALQITNGSSADKSYALLPSGNDLTLYEYASGTTGTSSAIMCFKAGGSIFVGYTSDPTSGNKLAVNGNSFFNGSLTALGLATFNSAVITASLSTQDLAYSGSFIRGNPQGSDVVRIANDGSTYVWLQASGGTGAGFITSFSNGTTSAPTAATAGKFIGLWSMRGYNGSAWSTGADAYIAGVASETWSSSTKGNYIAFYTTLTNSTAVGERVRIENVYGGLMVAYTSNPGTYKLAVYGNSYLNGSLTVIGASTFNNPITINSTAGLYQQVSGVNKAYFGYDASGYLQLYNYTSAKYLRLLDTGAVMANTVIDCVGLRIRNAANQLVNITVDANGFLHVDKTMYTDGGLSALGIA